MTATLEQPTTATVEPTVKQPRKSDALMEQIAKQLIESIEEGLVTGRWEKPWKGGMGIATNAATGRQYRGGNLVVLWILGAQFGPGPWATYKQWGELGGQVRKGEKGTQLVKWSPVPCREHGREENCGCRQRLSPRAFTVFHVSQQEGWTAPTVEEGNPDEARVDIEAFLAATGADIQFRDEGAAYYSLATDVITLPPFTRFVNAESFYATACHELVHWTGAEKRLNRDMAKKWGADGAASYAGEELVAELGSAMLCATLGISDEPREDHARYLKSWVAHLRNDYSLLWNAASLAQRAVDYLFVLAEGEASLPAE